MAHFPTAFASLTPAMTATIRWPRTSCSERTSAGISSRVARLSAACSVVAFMVTVVPGTVSRQRLVSVHEWHPIEIVVEAVEVLLALGLKQCGVITVDIVDAQRHEEINDARVDTFPRLGAGPR